MILFIALPLAMLLVLVLAPILRYWNRCDQCDGKRGFQSSKGWIPCWVCLRKGRIKAL